LLPVALIPRQAQRRREALGGRPFSKAKLLARQGNVVLRPCRAHHEAVTATFCGYCRFAKSAQHGQPLE
jgi:hypothetical protein